MCHGVIDMRIFMDNHNELASVWLIRAPRACYHLRTRPPNSGVAPVLVPPRLSRQKHRQHEQRDERVERAPYELDAVWTMYELDDVSHESHQEAVLLPNVTQQQHRKQRKAKSLSA